ncbi:MAG: hypothetical protein A2172_00895 [Candidatus Woykebacteria bacterium RBG_13_40_15]|uniref:UDP-N-acetylglucosamine kinase n=1 Tax=Candidatus Woykebacteria bacterium RBG_13_40_15 TaxID=1802593 RepID=A0A1G1W8T5_9BACT|nr:MAG: hypothetical protein A2172_00895 [Candidatus Woykebacteria bacterium RBG_13_40_15]
MSARFGKLILMDENLNFDVLAEDNIRILAVPNENFKKPLCVILVGYPGAGKTHLVERLKQKFPFTVLSEEDMTSFLSPRATIFKRGAVEVFKLALKTIEHLLKKGKSCIYDANIKTREQRDLIKKAVEFAGGNYLLVLVNYPKEECYERSQKQNFEISRGEAKGFIVDRDFFEFEVASTHLPAPNEQHIDYDGQNEEAPLQLYPVLEERFKQSEQY